MRAEVAARLERPPWINVRTCLGTLLFAIAMTAGWHTLDAAEQGRLVWATGRDVPEGARLTSSDLESIRVDLPADQLAQYLDASTPLEGSLAVRSMSRGELVSAAAIAEPRTAIDARSISIPISADHAVGGDLSAGDLVDVLATVDARGTDAETILLVEAATVQDVVSDATFGGGEGSLTGITVSVPAEQAMKIALAVRAAEIDVVRVDGIASEVSFRSLGRGDL